VLAVLNESKDLVCGLQTRSIKSEYPEARKDVWWRSNSLFRSIKYREFLFMSSISASGKAMQI